MHLTIPLGITSNYIYCSLIYIWGQPCVKFYSYQSLNWLDFLEKFTYCQPERSCYKILNICRHQISFLYLFFLQVSYTATAQIASNHTLTNTARLHMVSLKQHSTELNIGSKSILCSDISRNQCPVFVFSDSSPSRIYKQKTQITLHWPRKRRWCSVSVP